MTNKKNPAMTYVPERHSRSRRRLLQSLAVGGAAVTVKSIPDQWAKPVLDVTTLPLHAQATCQAESLDCSLDQINASAPDLDNGSYDIDPTPLPADPTLPIAGPNGSVEINGWADRANQDSGTNVVCGSLAEGVGFIPSGTFSFTATVDPACGPIDLNAALSSNDADENLWSLGSGGNQTGVVDPDNGAVAFNNVVVNFAPPATIVDPGDRDALLRVRIAAPGGISDCVIDLTFTENFSCNTPPG